MDLNYGIISCIPIAVLIIGVIVTKKMAEMIFIASLIGAILVYKEDFFSGYIELLYQSLSNSSFQMLMVILLGFGGMTLLFEKSGSFMGLGNVLSKYANSPKKTMVLTWLIGVIMFVDDYLNVLSTSISMRPLADKNGVPREHLVYGVNAMGACACALVPFSSWAGFAIGTISEQGMGFSDYIRSIPYMFFPWCAVGLALLVALGVVPKFGLLKKGYERVAAGGPVHVEEKSGDAFVKIEVDESRTPSSPLNFVIPIVALIITAIYFDNDVVHGIFAGIAVQAVMYTAQRLMSLKEFMSILFEGMASMASLTTVVCFAYIMSSANNAMGFAPYLIEIISTLISPQFLPALVFLAVAAITFAAGSFWAMIVITVPIFIPLAVAMGVDPVIILASILSGSAFGSKTCFYSGTVFMTSAGTGVSNLTQVRIVAPYALTAAGLATIGLLIVGFVSV